MSKNKVNFKVRMNEGKQRKLRYTTAIIASSLLIASPLSFGTGENLSYDRHVSAAEGEEVDSAEILELPTVNEIVHGDTSVSGTGMPGANVDVTHGGGEGLYGTTVVDGNGYFTIELLNPAVAGEELIFAQYYRVGEGGYDEHTVSGPLYVTIQGDGTEEEIEDDTEDDDSITEEDDEAVDDEEDEEINDDLDNEGDEEFEEDLDGDTGDDAIYDEGYEAGYQDGYQDGFDEMYGDAFIDGFEAGYAEGYYKGYEVGYEDGLLENEAEKSNKDETEDKLGSKNENKKEDEDESYAVVKDGGDSDKPAPSNQSKRVIVTGKASSTTISEAPPVQKSTSSKVTTDQSGKDKLPNTATSTFDWMIGGLIAMFAGIAGLFTRKIRKNNKK